MCSITKSGAETGARVDKLYFVALCMTVWLVSGKQVASAQYSPQKIISTLTEGANRVYAGDLDGDGDVDVVSVSQLDSKIAWYENQNGLGQWGPQRIITYASSRVYALELADLDGDGDIDILAASQGDNKIAWYKNLGSGLFSNQNIITTETFVPSSVVAGDIDGDGDLDVISGSRDDNKIAWYENIDGLGFFLPQEIISTEASGVHAVFVADLDGDDDLDVAAALEREDKVVWFQNTDGEGAYGPMREVTATAESVRDVFATDLDGDGDQDLISASSFDDTIAWYENNGGGAFGSKQVVSTQADFANDVFAADLDGDGDQDLLSASINDGKIAVYENEDGAGSFGKQQIVTTFALGANSVLAANLDGDGDLDILSASGIDHKIAWYESFLGKGPVIFEAGQVINGYQQALSPHAVIGADIDGDGDQDVVSASYQDSKIAWYKNSSLINGNEGIGPQRIITQNAGGARDVFAVDMDGDGDLDIISASGTDNAVRWHENYDGAGSFDLTHQISNNTNNVYAVYAGDLDGDGDPDVLSASASDDKIAWYRNQDGKGTFIAENTITKAAKGATDVAAADIDGDGDLDVVSASTFDDKIAWYENSGTGEFSEQKVISLEADLAISVHIADVDGDGDLDVLSASSGDHKIAWYKNLDGHGSFGQQNVIAHNAYRAFSVYTSDLDGDGDVDIIAGTRDDNTVAWFENLGGGLFGPKRLISTFAMGVRSVVAFDVDLDGDPDVLSASQDDDAIAWYKNLSLSGIALPIEGHEVDGQYQLAPAYPNPFSTNTNLLLEVEQTQAVYVTLYDIQGRELKTVYSGMAIEGEKQQLVLDGNGLPAGVYFVRIQGEQFVSTQKMVKVGG